MEYTMTGDNNNYIFMSPVSDGIYRWNAQKSEGVDCFADGEDKYDMQLYSYSIKYRGCIFFSPWRAEMCIRYEVNSGEVKSISIEHGKVDEYYEMSIYNDQLYLIGLYTRNVYCYDDNLQFFKKIYYSDYSGEKISCRKRCREFSKKVYWEKNNIHIFDFIELEWKKYNSVKEDIKEALLVGEECYVVDAKNDFWVWSINDNSWSAVSLPRKADIVHLQDCGDVVNIYFGKGSEYLIFNKNNRDVICCENDFLNDEFNYLYSEIDRDTMLISAYKKSKRLFIGQDDDYYIYKMGDRLLKLPPLIEGEREQSLFIDGFMSRQWRNCVDRNSFMYEVIGLGINEILGWLSTSRRDEQETREKCVGYEIYNAIKLSGNHCE